MLRDAENGKPFFVKNLQKASLCSSQAKSLSRWTGKSKLKAPILWTRSILRLVQGT
jgi:hypothetical protein